MFSICGSFERHVQHDVKPFLIREGDQKLALQLYVRGGKQGVGYCGVLGMCLSQLSSYVYNIDIENNGPCFYKMNVLNWHVVAPSEPLN